ncbi:oligopeptide/dipeptide ABC transporter, ATP-binding protein, C-terminal domain-containing protein [Amycolatopsis xylanica]|uniref:Oligopeptide/dipeptide ABC transporter, ATP-binding protein, C-terminal domain-containing protein n=1 Tax=Amycolatopsis xylanica TaxID=589385 RepID=A0A1H3CUY8_9PSEU|nr:ABC transporter ATP-binding protein [Amycolatopsis xylanica]SDX57718.1 oligopeptide/dipeptide ABC transporter, ATP-binding protein, C-terminal domain-containing protein [Amycolatopsis xylanica]
MNRPLLTVEGLGVTLDRDKPVLRDVSLTLERGEALGLVGESGAGKSMTARAVAALLPANAVATGSIRFGGQELLGARGEALRRIRREMAVVFQDPRAHINPVRRIGDFLTEQSSVVGGLDRREATRRAQRMLTEVGITDTARCLRHYPSDLSGGMLQRVMIAAALLGEPKLILADEPTTALDVTTQSEVMAILDELRRDAGVALLFITHDLDLAAAVCDRTAVMYAGQIIETQPSGRLHTDPLHPYAAALAAARPDLDSPAHRLAAIPGRPVAAWEAATTCAFADRCAHRVARCTTSGPVPLEGGVRCLRAGELSLTKAVTR